MRRFDLRRHCYVFLWLGLLLSVGAVWALGGGTKKQAAVPAETESRWAPEDVIIPPQTEQEAAEMAAAETEEKKKSRELAGVWVPYMSLAAGGRTRAAFEENFRRIADGAAEKGLNALFVHVRPFCDALYPSELYPWSHIVTGEQGRDPGFDPLLFMVEYTHRLGMEFHAWVNPLRIKTTETPAKLSADNPYPVLKEDYPYYFMEYEGAVYWNPAWPYVRRMIADGAAEIAKKYDVDGVHFDDYFYPCKGEELDREAYELYTRSTEEPLPLSEWRRANVSAMVQEVYARIKEVRPEVEFGISPQGNIANDMEMGADVKAWCAVPGYVDYLCPQLYYSFDNPALGFSQAMEEWLGLPRQEGLKLYAGLALYKAGSDADQGTWQPGGDLIGRQIREARAAECAGVVLYSSDYLDSGQTREEVENAVAALAEPEQAAKAEKE